MHECTLTWKWGKERIARGGVKETGILGVYDWNPFFDYVIVIEISTMAIH